MNVSACAALLERGDPDRFVATMAAPPVAREVLFPLFAFNLEVARAPWVATEPMIAEMRLQFWRDVVEDIGNGKQPRAHKVAEPLAQIIEPNHVDSLDALIEARRWDIYRGAFEDETHFEKYINATSGNLIWTAAQLLGAETSAEEAVRDLAYAAGIAGLLRAAPELEARGRIPLLDGSASGIRSLAKAAMTRWQQGRADQKKIAKPARTALYCLWRTPATLTRAIESPQAVADGALDESDFAKKARLMRVAFSNRL